MWDIVLQYTTITVLLLFFGVWIVSWLINVLLLMVFAFLMFDGAFGEMAEIRSKKEELKAKGTKRRKFKVIKGAKDEDGTS